MLNTTMIRKLRGATMAPPNIPTLAYRLASIHYFHYWIKQRQGGGATLSKPSLAIIE